jgi:hypothetical protein
VCPVNKSPAPESSERWSGGVREGRDSSRGKRGEKRQSLRKGKKRGEKRQSLRKGFVGRCAR